MSWPRRHVCHEFCRCPKCDKAVYYHAPSNEHACVDPACAWREAHDLDAFVWRFDNDIAHRIYGDIKWERIVPKQPT